MQYSGSCCCVSWPAGWPATSVSGKGSVPPERFEDAPIKQEWLGKPLCLLGYSGQQYVNEPLILSGGVFHGRVPLRDAGHPAGEGADAARSLAWCGLLPVS